MKRGLQTRDAEMNLAQGREVIATIFAQSSPTRGSGTYAAEFRLDEHTTFLRWVGTMDGHKIESLEGIVDNDSGAPYCPPAVSGAETVPRCHVCITQG